MIEIIIVLYVLMALVYLFIYLGANSTNYTKYSNMEQTGRFVGLNLEKINDYNSRYCIACSSSGGC